MSARFMSMILFAATTLVLAACQQQSKAPVQEQAPAAMQPAPAPAAKPEAQAMTSTKPETPAPKPAAPVAMTSKPPTPPAETSSAPAMTAKPAAAAPKPAPKPEVSSSKPLAMSTTANTFDTKKCATCHSIDHDKVGPAWKTVAEKYGDEATLAKDFEAGFKERRVANSIAKWKSKEGLMSMQYRNLIKGHEKEAAHALFESVKNGKFGDY